MFVATRRGDATNPPARGRGRAHARTDVCIHMNTRARASTSTSAALVAAAVAGAAGYAVHEGSSAAHCLNGIAWDDVSGAGHKQPRAGLLDSHVGHDPPGVGDGHHR